MIRFNSKRLVTIAIFVSISLLMFMLESLIPLPFLAPGAKFGLSNVVTVTALYVLPSELDALIILILRTLMSSIFVGSPTVMMFSMSGGLMSFIAMFILKRIGKFSVIGVSAAGGFFHNVGQILIAVIIMQNVQIVNYLTILGLCGIFTGIIIGIVACEITIRLIK